MAERFLHSACDIDGHTIREYDEVKLVGETKFESGGKVRILPSEYEVTVVDMTDRDDGKITLEAYLADEEWWGLALVRPSKVRFVERAKTEGDHGDGGR